MRLSQTFLCLFLLLAAGVASDALAASPPQGLAVPANVVSVYDGDTMTVEIRLRVNVRLCGDGMKQCWAPELKEPGGPKSKESLQLATMGRHGTLWIPLGNATNLSQLFTLGRVLGDFWVDGEEESVSEMQVRTKHAATKKGGALGE